MKVQSVCMGVAGMITGRRAYKSGIFKQPVFGPVMVDSLGIVGDQILNKKHHGGPEQAIYAEGSDDIAFWEQTLGRALPSGMFGENMVIDGMSNRDLAAGDQIRIGMVVLEVTSPRMPCSTFAARMGLPTFVKTYTKACRPGAYFRVLTGGFLEAGMDAILIPYEGHRVSLMDMMRNCKKHPDGPTRDLILGAPVSSKLKDFLTSQ